jgi:hypothetical protein
VSEARANVEVSRGLLGIASSAQLLSALPPLDFTSSFGVYHVPALSCDLSSDAHEWRVLVHLMLFGVADIRMEGAYYATEEKLLHCGSGPERRLRSSQ